MAIAHDAGLEARIVHPKWKQLSRLANVLPAIVRLRDGGAAVLMSVAANEQVGQVVLLAGAGGDNEIALDETHFAELWNGEIILVKRRYKIDDEQQPFGMRWLVNQVLVERRLFREIAMASVLGTILALIPPFMMMIIVDRVLVNHSISTCGFWQVLSH